MQQNTYQTNRCSGYFIVILFLSTVAIFVGKWYCIRDSLWKVFENKLCFSSSSLISFVDPLAKVSLVVVKSPKT